MNAGRYDAIVIGAGHNGLIAAAYFARAGKKVLVLERRDIVGGAAVTEEIFPGYRFTEFSYVVSLLRPEIIRDLELPKHGLKILPLPSTVTPRSSRCTWRRPCWPTTKGCLPASSPRSAPSPRRSLAICARPWP